VISGHGRRPRDNSDAMVVGSRWATPTRRKRLRLIRVARRDADVTLLVVPPRTSPALGALVIRCVAVMPSATADRNTPLFATADSVVDAALAAPMRAVRRSEPAAIRHCRKELQCSARQRMDVIDSRRISASTGRRQQPQLNSGMSGQRPSGPPTDRKLLPVRTVTSRGRQERCSFSGSRPVRWCRSSLLPGRGKPMAPIRSKRAPGALALLRHSTVTATARGSLAS
jgi:hypothetical protein